MEQIIPMAQIAPMIYVVLVVSVPIINVAQQHFLLKGKLALSLVVVKRAIIAILKH